MPPARPSRGSAGRPRPTARPRRPRPRWWGRLLVAGLVLVTVAAPAPRSFADDEDGAAGLPTPDGRAPAPAHPGPEVAAVDLELGDLDSGDLHGDGDLHGGGPRGQDRAGGDQGDSEILPTGGLPGGGGTVLAGEGASATRAEEHAAAPAAPAATARREPEDPRGRSARVPPPDAPAGCADGGCQDGPGTPTQLAAAPRGGGRWGTDQPFGRGWRPWEPDWPVRDKVDLVEFWSRGAWSRQEQEEVLTWLDEVEPEADPASDQPARLARLRAWLQESLRRWEARERRRPAGGEGEDTTGTPGSASSMIEPGTAAAPPPPGEAAAGLPAALPGIPLGAGDEPAAGGPAPGEAAAQDLAVPPQVATTDPGLVRTALAGLGLGGAGFLGYLAYRAVRAVLAAPCLAGSPGLYVACAFAGG